METIISTSINMMKCLREIKLRSEMDTLDESAKKLIEMEPKVRLRIDAAKLALLIDQGDAKVDECLKAINEGNELIQRIREVLRSFN